MVSHVFDFYKKVELQVHILLYSVLCVGIIYVKNIPVSLQQYSSNPFVRTVLFALILVLCKYVSYMHSLLFALFVILYLSLTPGASTREGYKNGNKEGYKEGYETIKLVESKKTKGSLASSNGSAPKHRWGDEIIFNERPKMVENDNVVTEQIQ
jgi:hypothetical protein